MAQKGTRSKVVKSKTNQTLQLRSIGNKALNHVSEILGLFSPVPKLSGDRSDVGSKKTPWRLEGSQGWGLGTTEIPGGSGTGRQWCD